MKITRLLIYISVIITTATSCTKSLDEPVYSQLVPDNFLNTEDGINSLLNAAYIREAHVQSQNASKGTILSQEAVTDIMFQYAGADNRQMAQFLNFTWDSNLDWINSMLWSPSYLGIRDANTVLDNIDGVSLSETSKELYIAEARFVRAACYYSLYTFFGPVPIRKTTLNGSEELEKATDEEMKNFIENEFLDIIPTLPDPGTEIYGRANKGAARAFLVKFYLNTKQWQKCADMALTVMNMKKYDLNPDYAAMFKVENERNKEYIWVRPCFQFAVGDGPGNDWSAYVLPIGFKSDPVTGITFLSNFRNYAAMYTLRDAFFKTFEANDKRKSIIMTSYIDNSNKTINLDNGTDNTRPIKFWPDAASISGGGGNDIPVIRYADILLSRSEALNELSSVPTMEAFTLLTDVHNRSNPTPLVFADFPTQQSFRDYLLKERGWEFFCEGLRRQDLIRMGKFIDYAIARGVTNAKPYHVLYPIPQQAIESDSKIVQNTGYN